MSFQSMQLTGKICGQNSYLVHKNSEPQPLLPFSLTPISYMVFSIWERRFSLISVGLIIWVKLQNRLCIPLPPPPQSELFETGHNAEMTYKSSSTLRSLLSESKLMRSQGHASDVAYKLCSVSLEEKKQIMNTEKQNKIPSKYYLSI